MGKILKLCKYEFYKIVYSRLTIVVILLMMVLTVVMGLPLGQSDEAKDIQKAMRSLDGQILDTALLQEMNASIDREDPDWHPDTWKWVGVNYIVSLVESTSEPMSTADQLYEMRIAAQQRAMAEGYLSEGEITWWEGRRDEVKTPFTYVSSYDARSLSEYMYNILLMSLLLAAVCLSTVFAGEHRRGMDQIILSTKHGRGETFVAKMLAGFIFILLWTAVLTALLTVTIFLTKGLAGLQAIVQMEVPISAYPYTFLQFFEIQVIILFAAAILFAALSMAFSEILRNGLAVMGLMIGGYLLTQFISIPSSMRVLSQAVAMIPTEIIPLWRLLDYRLIGVFGEYHTMFSVAPIIYLVIALVLCTMAWLAYRRYQVGSR